MRRARREEPLTLTLSGPRLAARRASLADARELQACLESAPRYYTLTEGKPPRPETAAEMLADAEFDDRRHLFLLAPRPDRPAVGLLDLYLDYPEPRTAQIGLLLFREACQGQGYGRETTAVLEAALWQMGDSALRIAVLDGNPEASLFWERLGFSAIGRLDRAATVYEKVLG